jgi:hypothetical protein
MPSRSDPGELADDESGGTRSSHAEPVRSDRTTKWSIDRLDERERRFSFIASAGAVLFGVVVYLVETENSKFRLHKGQLTPQTTLIVGLVAGGLLFGATMLGRRAPVGFVALFTGIAFSNSNFVLSLPFLALAIWILYHSYKIQKETAAAARAARAEARASRSSPNRSGAGSPKSAGASSGKSRRSAPARPEANKRYTPKRPPPPAPKPSRRERKGTRAAD